MAYTFKQNLVPSSKYSVKCPYSMTPQYITIHNTSNNASAKNEIAYMISNNNQTSYHVAVDEKEVIQAIPFNRNAWHAGDGANGNGNRKSIGIEICRSTGDVATFKKCEENCAKYVATLLKQYGWGVNKVKQHYDWSGKNCPHKTRELGWNRFVQMIQKELDALNKKNTTTTTTTSSSSSIKVGDKVKVKSSAKTYANSTKTIPNWVKTGTYTVSKVDKTKVLLKEISSWVNLSDVGKVGTNFTSYAVRITADVLNVRQTASATSKVTTTVKKGQVFTIVDEENGWGKLKSGAGWVNLSYTQRV